MSQRQFSIPYDFPVCLAPMVGLSHIGLRALVGRYTPQGITTIWPTEMLNSRRLPNENLTRTPETYRAAHEQNLVPQILGNEELPIRLSVKKLEEEWGASGIDINMGCPVQKALKHNYGVALMGDASYAAKVVEMTVKNTKLPVSVKLRAGIDESPDKLIAFVKGLESAGASWITLHPRFAHEKRRGSADWTKIKAVRDSLSIPVIGNGDVQVAEDVFTMMQISECDKVMVGRALTARPWLMWQVGEKLNNVSPLGFENRKAPITPEEEGLEYGHALNFFIEVMKEHFEESLGVRKIKFFARTSTVWLEFGNHLYAQIMKCNSYEELLNAAFKYIETPQRMMSRTQLRT